MEAGSRYREKRRRTVILPTTGEESVIRKPGAKTYTRLFDLFKAEDVSDDFDALVTQFEDLTESPELMQSALGKRTIGDLVQLIDVMLIDCVIKPKIVAEYTEKPDELWIEEIELEDYFFWFQQIMEFANITPERLRELFRDSAGASRTVGRGNLSTVRHPTESDSP